MDQYIVLKNIELINANAISGFTYGFPAITHFLGFVHAMSRKLSSVGVEMSDVAVICHDYCIRAYRNSTFSPYLFSQTRNPLTKNAKVAPINEEGRMSLRVSLIVRCNGINEINETKTRESCALIKSLAEQQKLAGGRIVSIGSCYLADLQRFTLTRLLRSLMPGFVLIDRSDLLQESKKDMLATWLEYCSLQYQAQKIQTEYEETLVSWNRSNLHQGYIVPLAIGFKAIAQLQEAGSVANARDMQTPSRLVETVFGLAEWVGSPSRIKSIGEILWHYEYQDPFYITKTGSAIENVDDFYKSEDDLL